MAYLVRNALPGDVDAIYQLIKHYAEEGVILERSRDDILDNINSFIVAVNDDAVIGTVTHFDYGTNLVEVRSLAVNEKFQGSGIGKALLSELIRQVTSVSRVKIFTLTYKPGFFEQSGFTRVPKEEFPEKIWKDCLNCKDQENCGESALVYNY